MDVVEKINNSRHHCQRHICTRVTVGYGKTFSASTWALFTSNILPPAINIRFITEGVMCVVFERAEDMITSIYVSVIKV